MSKLREYRDTQLALNESLQHLEALKNNTELTKELEFEKRLMTLLKRYSKRTEDLLAFIKPAHETRLQIQERRRAYGKVASNKPE